MGVFLFSESRAHPCGSLPHARGGVSALLIKPMSVIPVFPTLVGVFLPSIVTSVVVVCLPHARGGVSSMNPGHIRRCKSSPRSWGCFRLVLSMTEEGEVFPTLVGVFRNQACRSCGRAGLPHARGGVSGETWFIEVKTEVFPTLVGVFPPLP